MPASIVVTLLYFYGLFLILCGIIAVLFIGLKAKTALASGGLSGVIALGTGYLVSLGNTGAQNGGCFFHWHYLLFLPGAPQKRYS
jgi:hypothetical protein